MGGQCRSPWRHLATVPSRLSQSDTLAASMSDYLVKSIDRTPNINIRFETDVADGGGEGRLDWLDLKL